MTVPFIGLWLFTLLLYARPNDLFPQLVGNFPLVKLVAIGAILTYFGARLARGEPLTIWPFELKMLFLILGLAVFLLPVAASPGDSWQMLADPFFKVVSIFILLINIVDTSERLRSLMKLVVICGSVIALSAIHSFLTGQFDIGEYRIKGIVSGMFGNPNDLAIALDLLVPLALALAFNSRGAARVFYGGCVVVLSAGVIATFSRGGFLGLVAAGIVLVWKLGRGKRAATVLWAALALGAFVLAAPGGYGNRLATIISIEEDQTGSAQGRRELLKRAAYLALRHSVIGVGMGNFHIYSIREHVAHNSYLEIAAELGLAGLLAYLALIFAPLRSMQQVERAEGHSHFRTLSGAPSGKAPPGSASRGPATEAGRRREIYHLSVALQAAFVVYIVCSFFGSIQYFWFLYYIVAYSIALRRIHAAARVSAPDSELEAQAAEPLTLWHSRPGHGGPRPARPRTRLGLLNQGASE